jgi:UDP-N-acetylmuramoylalanine--D-glutamate ligase
LRLLVLGAAVSGSAAARLGRRKGHSVTVYDQRPAAGANLLGEGIGVVTGRWDPDLLVGIELVVTSPGVPLRAAPITDAREAGIPVWSEIEFAWRHLHVPMVAVTGTNGKTTVTEATAAMLASSGMAVAAVGNIGTALSAVVDEPYDLLVTEVSSFQLDLTDAFRPETAVLTNLAPDHLDWHPSFAAYAAAKAKIFANQEANDLLIFDDDDPGARSAVVAARSRQHPVSGVRRPEGGTGPEGDWLRFPGAEVELSSLPSRDPIILVDLAAAGVAALDRGAVPEAVAAICRRFRPGANRRQLVGELEGVTFVNDSKATNPHAAMASIRSFPRVVLIAGGLAKGLDVTPLGSVENVRALVAIGEAAPLLVAAAPEGRATTATDMGEAVELAYAAARPGDTVLLAPGCASFDMFDDYADRGAAFASAVGELIRRVKRS